MTLKIKVFSVKHDFDAESNSKVEYFVPAFWRAVPSSDHRWSARTPRWSTHSGQSLDTGYQGLVLLGSI